MAEVTGKKIKQLEAATTINTTDDFIIETTPSTGSPVTKRAAASVVKEMINRELNSALGGRAMQSGRVTITPKANEPTMKRVTFPKPFKDKADVMLTPITSVPGTTVLGVGTDNNTKDGFDAYVYRTNTTETILTWVAFGQM